jgi:hypothetical protein
MIDEGMDSQETKRQWYVYFSGVRGFQRLFSGFVIVLSGIFFLASVGRANVSAVGLREAAEVTLGLWKSILVLSGLFPSSFGFASSIRILGFPAFPVSARSTIGGECGLGHTVKRKTLI